MQSAARFALRAAQAERKLVSVDVADAMKRLAERRASTPDGTQEIAAADILEAEPMAAPVAWQGLPWDTANPLVPECDIPIDVDAEEPPRSAAAGPVSIAPFAISVAPPRPTAESTFKIEAMPAPRKRLGAVVLGAMGMSVCILLLAAVRSGMADTAAEQASSVSAALPPVVPALTTRAAGAWEPSTAPSSGTIESHAGTITVDGTRITAKSAVVTCGHHQLRAGRAKSHDVDVPCGGTVVVDRTGKTSVR
jgi:hypothetical protein